MLESQTKRVSQICANTNQRNQMGAESDSDNSDDESTRENLFKVPKVRIELCALFQNKS